MLSLLLTSAVLVPFGGLLNCSVIEFYPFALTAVVTVTIVANVAAAAYPAHYFRLTSAGSHECFNCFVSPVRHRVSRAIDLPMRIDWSKLADVPARQEIVPWRIRLA